jgi:hypothetical protein
MLFVLTPVVLLLKSIPAGCWDRKWGIVKANEVLSREVRSFYSWRIMVVLQALILVCFLGFASTCESRITAAVATRYSDAFSSSTWGLRVPERGKEPQMSGTYLSASPT